MANSVKKQTNKQKKLGKDNGNHINKKKKPYCLRLLDLVSSEQRFVLLIVQQIK